MRYLSSYISAISVYFPFVLLALLIVATGLALHFYRKYKRVENEKQRLTLSNLTLTTDLDVARVLINPHFVFNSLSSLQNFILNKDHVQANDYMIKFSKLIRKMLESNSDNLTTIEQEILLLKSYLEFKEVNFEGKLHYTVEAEASVVPSETYIPVMMVQPFIENALWHGLLKNPGEKIISISFSLVQQLYVQCVISDNDGQKAAGQPDTRKKPAMEFIKQRLDLLNKIYHLNCTLTIEDNPLGQGTSIRILLPALRK